MEAAKKAGLEFQINTTVTRSNLGQIEDIAKMAVDLGAVALHIFLLVPTGRGRALSGEIITARNTRMCWAGSPSRRASCPWS